MVLLISLTSLQERIKSTDGTQISLCISSVDSNINIKLSTPAKTVYILYFQGISP